MTPLFACRMIRLSLDHGMCKDSILGFVQYAAGICHHSTDAIHVQEACRIGKEAMALLGRFGSSPDIKPKLCLIYYSYVAPCTEPQQNCTKYLRKGFEGEQTNLPHLYSIASNHELMSTHFSSCLHSWNVLWI